MAGRRVGAAGEACADYRLCRADKSCGPKPKYERIFAAAARTRLDRPAKQSQSNSLGGGLDAQRLDEIAAELVRLKVDLIVTSSTNDSIVMKQVAPQIPMVFAVSGDPVGFGLVASLARPGGNVTGLSI